MALVYNCCFWFSLRLGGILIGIFSIAFLGLIGCSLAYKQSEIVGEYINEWTHDLNLIYAKEYINNFKSGPGKYLFFGIIVTCVYIILCLMFIYGAYTCNNIMMINYILVELLRLVLLSIVMATTLLLIKQNTMDIGLLIGASVAGGFLLLGMFYLWICTANLPILIKEMEYEANETEVRKLRQLLEAQNQNTFQELGGIPFIASGASGGVSVSRNCMRSSGVFPIPSKNRGNMNVRIPNQRVNNKFY